MLIKTCYVLTKVSSFVNVAFNVFGILGPYFRSLLKEA